MTPCKHEASKAKQFRQLIPLTIDLIEEQAFSSIPYLEFRLINKLTISIA